MTNNKNLPLYKPYNYPSNNADNIFGLTVENYVGDRYILSAENIIHISDKDGCLMVIPPNIRNYN